MEKVYTARVMGQCFLYAGVGVHFDNTYPRFMFYSGVVSVANGLTARQQRFVDEYMVDLNATQAAIRAGYSERSAQVIGAENLTKPIVAAEIQARRAAMSEKLEITREWVLQELAAIAKANATDFVTVETEKADRLCIHPITGEVVTLPIGLQQCVRVLDTNEVPVDKRAAIAGIKQGKNGIEVKLHDKVRALEMLGRHLGLFENKDTPAGVENNLFAAIVSTSGEEVDTDDIPEIEQEATAGNDVVEPVEV